MKMAITIGSPPYKVYAINDNNTPRTNNVGGRGQRKRPQIFISTNPSHVNLHALSNLYTSCSHSPCRLSTDIDTGKLAVAVAHSSVVVSVYGGAGGGGGMKVVEKVFPRVLLQNGELVGFGRAVSDMGFTASIYDVMVIPPLQGMGIGRMIVQRILRTLSSRGIYDISALCSKKERLFFEACGFGDDILGSTTMMYTKTSSNLDDRRSIFTKHGYKPSTLPYQS